MTPSPAPSPGGRTRRAFWARSTTLVIATGTALIGLVVILALAAASLLREREVVLWTKQLSGLSLVVAEQVKVNLSAAQLVMDGVQRVLQETRPRDPEALRKVASTPQVHALLRERSASLPHIDVVSIADAEGRIVNFSRSYPPPLIDISDRDYFTAQRDATAPGPHVSTSVRNRGNGAWVFYLSRRLEGPGHEFLGVLLVGISVESLTNFHGRLGENLGQDASISLLRDDFTMLARWPPNDPVIGKVSATGSTHRVIAQQKRKDGVVLVAGPRLDGSNPDDRLAAVRVVDGFPLIVNVTATSDLYLSGWRSAVASIGGLAGVAAAVIAVATFLLYRLIARREADVERLRDLKLEAEQASEAKSYFVAAVSHELRTPLNGVIGMAEIMADGELSNEQRRNIDILRSSATSLLRTVDDVLDFSKMAAGKLQLQPRDFHLKLLLRDLRDLFSSRASAKGLLLTMKTGEALPDWVHGDPERIYQVLGNFLGNALKFTQHGQIGLEAVQAAGRAGENVVRFSVTDTGIGIPLAAQDKLFTPFSQADPTSTRRFGGTGLGLVISRQLADLMDARIGFDSTEGRGSNFWVEIPLPKALTPAPVESTGLSGAREPNPDVRVLVAEDNPTNQLVATRLLKMIGLPNVTVVGSGQEVLNRLATESYDLVLMDCQMPVMDGYEATRRLRQQGMTMPIIAMTANAMSDDRQRCIEAGMNDHVPKPVAVDQLEKVVRRWLASAQGEAPPRAPFAAAEPPGEPVLDAQAALERLEDDAALYRQVLEFSMADIPAQLEQLQPSLARDTDEARRIVHSMKGAASAAGAMRLAEVAQRIEQSLAAGDLAAAGRHLDALGAAVADFCSAAATQIEAMATEGAA